MISSSRRRKECCCMTSEMVEDRNAGVDQQLVTAANWYKARLDT
jgi:hypothetical protein